MSKPIIYVVQELHNEQIALIQKMAPDYQVITAKEAPTLTFEEDQIEILFGWRKDLGTRLLKSSTSRLKWIQMISAGVDYIDLETIRKKGILVSNGSGIHAVPIAESVIGILLAHTRSIQPSILNQQKKTWQPDLTFTELPDKKILIVGTGNIGIQLAKLSHAFGMLPIGVNRTGHDVSGFAHVYAQEKIDSILPEADIVVNILPLTAETHYFYDSQRFSAMKDGVLFINVGRGPSVNTSDLLAALVTKKIAFAGLDVFEEEPLPVESPLWEMENVLITPHTSGQAEHFKNKLFAIFAENLPLFIQSGTLARNNVDLTLGY